MIEELRIGNLLTDKAGFIYKVGEISSSTQTIFATIGDNDTSQYHLNIENVEGIVLTEELLIRFGYEKLDTMMSGCVVYQKGYWRVARRIKPQEDDYFVLWHQNISPPTWNLASFKHVHTFQNIMFGLQSKELELKI